MIYVIFINNDICIYIYIYIYVYICRTKEQARIEDTSCGASYQWDSESREKKLKYISRKLALEQRVRGAQQYYVVGK